MSYPTPQGGVGYSIRSAPGYYLCEPIRELAREKRAPLLVKELVLRQLSFDAVEHLLARRRISLALATD